METLGVGSRSIAVKLAQRLLNKKGAQPVVSEGGVFDFRTDAAVRTFQKENGLPVTRMVDGPTWQKLGIQIEITHEVSLIPEVAGLDCWEAAIAMLQGSVPPTIPDTVGRLRDGSLIAEPDNIYRLSEGLGWEAYQVSKWSLPELTSLMRMGPLWAAGGGINLRERFPAGYVVVLSALWSDGDPDLTGTMIRFHNPRPAGKGSIDGKLYRGASVNFDFRPDYFLLPIAPAGNPSVEDQVAADATASNEVPKPASKAKGKAGDVIPADILESA